ncbi:sugar phosphate isomerase/epimerase family protein [Dethiobacter alkaliphilus]|uniref:sugar phosphate isomerase/epimerase family protein n=1 Tax=Dethiobacter alkaliphilus TaxID=427926 RepID=UPI002227620C|nr:sugar phosphate isomerase/epimerase [Dethiobacter alkaliphilus]MCW3489990.1 sugar phosphate isomerase/epimerase [Dethiobacter alkaliphilus]
MKICFNQATTMKHSTLVQDLEFCEKHGYDLIEIRLDKLRHYLESHTIEDLAAFFQDNKLKPFAFNALEFINFRDDAGYKQIKDDLLFLCEVGEKIDCRKIVVVPTFDIGHYTRAAIKEECVRVLHDLADTAEKYNIRLAFEFVGYPHCSVNTFGQTYDIVQAVNRASVGVVLDCFHFHAMNSNFEDLEAAQADKIFIFHIDDCEDIPPGVLRDNHRVWPGDGVIALDRILSTLKKIGYNEMVSVELFNPDYWEMEIEEIIRIAKEKTEQVISKHF